jgi:hypothetical protein
MKYEVFIPGWRPATKNDLMKRHKHWGGAASKKTRDFKVIANALMVFGVRPAEGKRRVSIRYTVPHPRWFPDPDAMYPSLLDALKRNRALIDDSDRYCEPTKPEFAVGPKGIVITIEDIA